MEKLFADSLKLEDDGTDPMNNLPSNKYSK